MKPILCLLAATLLAGCVAGQSGQQGRPHDYKAFALQQIALWNAAGVDPLQVRPDALALMAALCGTATSLSTVIDPTTPDTPEAILDYCGLVMQAAAPAA